MKKIIAISVMFALLAGVAFADTSLGGNIRITANLLSGKAEADDVMAGDVHVYDSNLSANWSGDDAGGMLRLHGFGSDGGAPVTKIDWTPDYFGFVWWKPIDQFRLQIGKNADGDWGHQQISGWGYNAEAQNGAAVDQYRGIGPNAQLARTAGWYGGFSSMGVTLSIFPTQGFEIDVGIPMAATKTAKETYMSSDLNIKADIPDVGTVRVALDLDQGGGDADLMMGAYLGFYLSMIENMGIDIGAAFKPAGGENFKEIGFGLGFRYTADDLTIKARFGLVTNDGAMALGFGILPSYNLGSFVFLFNAGFGMNPDAETKDWFVNPYIKVPTSAGSFYAGIKIIDNGDELISWAVPIQWNVYY